jgi:hypothetical protein
MQCLGVAPVVTLIRTLTLRRGTILIRSQNIITNAHHLVIHHPTPWQQVIYKRTIKHPIIPTNVMNRIALVS